MGSNPTHSYNKVKLQPQQSDVQQKVKTFFLKIGQLNETEKERK